MRRTIFRRAAAGLGLLFIAQVGLGCYADDLDENRPVGAAKSALPALHEKDLAPVFPLDDEAPIRITDVAPSGGRHFPAQWYEALLDSYRNTLVGDALLFENVESDWRVVSARIVPCSWPLPLPIPDSEVLCWPELRVVWQPVVENVVVGGVRSDFYGDDRAVHTLYDVAPASALPPAEAARAAGYLATIGAGGALSAAEREDFIALRDQVAHAYLLEVYALRGAAPEAAYIGHGPRPESFDAAEALAFSDRFRAFLDRHGRPSALKILTSFSLPEGRQPALFDDWVFLAFRGVDGAISPADIRVHSAIDGRSLINLGPAQRASMARDDDRVYDLLDDPAVGDELAAQVLLFGGDRERLLPLVRDRRALTVPNTSCASCHKFNALRFDFHNLSYLEDRDITVSPRVITDVALDLDWIERAFGGGDDGGGDDGGGDDGGGNDPPPPPLRYEVFPNLAIPDNNAAGIVSELAVPVGLSASEVAVEVDIEHTYVGDLIVRLRASDGTLSTLHNRSGGSSDDLALRITLDLTGEPAGTWQLEVSDRAGADLGVLTRWSLDFAP